MDKIESIFYYILFYHIRFISFMNQIFLQILLTII